MLPRDVEAKEMISAIKKGFFKKLSFCSLLGSFFQTLDTFRLSVTHKEQLHFGNKESFVI